MDKVSIIIPSYNHAGFIKNAVESVLSQIYKHFELIIIDDGSSDGSWEYISSLNDPRIIKFKQENAGAHNAINRGLTVSTGEFLAILNSDDEYKPNRLEKFINVFSSNPNIDCLCSYIEIIDEHGNVLGVKDGWHNCEPWLIAHPELSYKTIDNFNKNLIMSNFVSTTSNIFFRRNVLENTGDMRNLRFSHDWDYFLRIAENHPCDIIREPLIRYRIHGSNTISTNRKWLLFEICLVVAMNIRRFYGKDIFASHDKADLTKQISLLANSMNFQGNDKVVWLILMYLSAMRKLEVKNPENLLMDDADLRQVFIDQIVDDSDNSNTAHTIKEKLTAIWTIIKNR
jgi:glycosyltransferase involved in cell wall biosynthesis